MRKEKERSWEVRTEQAVDLALDVAVLSKDSKIAEDKHIEYLLYLYCAACTLFHVSCGFEQGNVAR